MKTKLTLNVATVLLSLLTLMAQLSTAHAQGTAFTYQGRLNDGASPGNGIYDLRFTIYASTNSPGTIVAGPSTNSAVAVSNGLFTTALDFGAGVFAGNPRWLEISVQKNGGGFTPLSPRQQLTATPYAILAASANSLTSLVVQQNANGAPNMIGGSPNNFVSTGVIGATIGGGGATNYVGASQTNSVTADFGTVSGGSGNTASGTAATVSGGDGNTASGFEAMVGGGALNTASGSHATVGGGLINTASGSYATVPGGYLNTASGNFSFAAGWDAQAQHDGSFVWSDDIGVAFASTANNQFSVRAAGGIRFAGDVQLSGGNAYHNLSLSGGNSLGFLYGSFLALADGIHLGYNWYYDANGTGHIINIGGGTSRISADYGEIILAVGAVNTAPNTYRLDATTAGVTVYGTFNNSSDRNVKQDFAPVNASQILDKVLQLPVSEWSYKEDPTTRHIGPMGQDFYSTFNIGTDDKHIAPIDEGGIAFAAIQGLNQKLNERDAEIRDLKQSVADLKKMVQSLAEKK